jgi:hypothetical protein
VVGSWHIGIGFLANGRMSTVLASPSKIRSARHVPTAGAILKPEPLNAVAR